MCSFHGSAEVSSTPITDLVLGADSDELDIIVAVFGLDLLVDLITAEAIYEIFG